GGETVDKRLWMALLYGWTIILFIVLTSSAVLAIVIKHSNITEQTLSYITLIIGLVTLFIGGLVAGLRGKSNGWMLGFIVGLGFSLLILLIQYLGFNEIFSVKQIVFHITYILCAVVGSIVGVNLQNYDQQTV